MPKAPKRNVIPQMFDVRPVDRSGGLDWERIRSVGDARRSEGRPGDGEVSVPAYAEEVPEIREEGRACVSDDAVPHDGSAYGVFAEAERWEDEAPTEIFEGTDDGNFYETDFLEVSEEPEYPDAVSARRSGNWDDDRFNFASERFGPSPKTVAEAAGETWGMAVSFLRSNGTFTRNLAYVSVFAVCAVIGIASGRHLVSVQGEVLGESAEGLRQISEALDDLSSADFETSARTFSEARDSFASASGSLGFVGGELAKAARFIPFLSKFSSGQGLLEGAEHLSSAAGSLTRMIAMLPGASDGSADGDLSFLDLVDEAEDLSVSASEDFAAAEEAFARVDPKDVPEEKREAFLMVREKLPAVRAALDGFHDHSFLLRDLLGQNGPRLYLFLFQNNDELRPTGGFIGSYGLLSVKNGHIGKFFIDGIFNPDGQLREDIVPPRPIRKVSAAWSLHDSNWWPDFPMSAEKAISFYEKTGGPTVDGVITLTPAVLQEVLRITGPIEMPEYGVTVDAENFIPVIQEEVEVNYDRELNQPKRILGDLAPVLLDRLLSSRDPASVLSLLDAFSTELSERHILMYSRNDDIQSLIREVGWSGELVPTEGDYASVVHANLNGYKTDGVIEDSVSHSADIRADGSVVDTIRITRKHTGGGTPYDWWNRVNSDYMRVYVPKGSELLSASGATYEFVEDPLDYEALGFRTDPDVEADEAATVIHESGTRVSEESGKTVFGNWVYVSPGESVTVEYTYLLPFSVFPRNGEPESYSFMFQKQSGMERVDFRHDLSYPDRFVPVWQSEGTEETRDGFSQSGTVSTDAYSGVVFTRS